ncbi:hypothetical protein N2152v2_008070 [Parachlorella kessleri]
MTCPQQQPTSLSALRLRRPSALTDFSKIPGSGNYTFACDYLVDNDLTCDDLYANITLVNTYVRTVADGVARWVTPLGYSPPLQITLQCSGAPVPAQCGSSSSSGGGGGALGDPRKRIRLYIAIQRAMTPRAVAAILGAAKALGVYSKYLADLNQALGAASPWGAAAIEYQYGVQSACVVSPPAGSGLALGACAGPWDPATQVDPPAEAARHALLLAPARPSALEEEAAAALMRLSPAAPICANFTDNGDPANGPCGSGCLCSPAIQQGGLALDTCNATEGSQGYGYCTHSGELYSECFPADALVQVEGSGPTRMDHLQIGQRVLTLDRKGRLVYEEVMYFGHQIPHQDLTVMVLQVHVAATNTSRTLRVSLRHFVPTLDAYHPGLRYKHAEAVEVG